MPAARRIAVAAAALAAASGVPATASADVVCDYAQSGKILEVRLTDSFDLAFISLSGATIVVSDSAVPVACTSNPSGLAPTLTNVDVVSISNEPGQQTDFVIIENAGAFGPGATNEADGFSEIEFFVNLNNAPNSVLSVRSSIPARFVFGENGINTNAGADGTGDVDVVHSNVEQIDAQGFNQGVTFDARGGVGTGGPLHRPLTLMGSRGNDVLIGSPFDDRLESYGGIDQLSGEGGDDSLDPGEDDDLVIGGAGRDVVDYATRFYPLGLTLDLGLTAPQQTGAAGVDAISGVEDVLGTQNADVITGDAGPNLIESFNGSDVIDGAGGPDELRAGGNADIVRVRDGQADVVDCGLGADEVTADAPGTDTLTGCETVLFPPVPGDPAGGGAGPPAPGPSVVVATPRAPLLGGLRITPRALQALAIGPSARTGGAGARVRFTLDRAASVGFRVARRAAGRRVGGRCVAVRPGTRLSPRCTRLVTLRGGFTRAGAVGTNAFRFTGRLRGRALAPGAYTLLATPRAGGLTGATARLPFAVRP